MDHKEIQTLYNLYFKRMVLIAHGYVKNIDVAQDLSQDVFVHLMKKGDKVTNPKAYLFTAVRNRCLDYLKTNAIHSQHLSGISDREEKLYYDQTLEYAELVDLLMKTLDQLPERQRIIFKKSRLEGKSNAEIANELSLSKRTVETQISNALKNLRATLAGFDFLT